MLGEDILLSALADAVFSYLFENYGGKLAEQLHDKIGTPPIKKAFKEALEEAFTEFQELYPIWVERLFDLHFFKTTGAPVLAQFLMPDGNPQPDELAERWANSLNLQSGIARSTYISDLEPIAADFLDILSHHLKNKHELRELNNQRAFEQLVTHLHTIRHKMEADQATSSTRRDYLHWLIQRNLYIDSRGTLQTQRQVQLKLDNVYVSLKAQRVEPTGLVDKLGLESKKASGKSKHPTGRLNETSVSGSNTSESTPVSGSNTGEALELAQIVNRSQLVTFLGEPGSGKTTLLCYLALHYARASLNALGKPSSQLDNVYFPIMVRIADYVEYGIPMNTPFSDFLAEYCRMHECPRYGLADLLETQLKEGHCLILLDGLDEIVSADMRRKVVIQIEEFVQRYRHRNHFVITSRLAGYRSAPLTAPFEHYVIQEMEEEQIQQFLERWCQAVEDTQTPEVADTERKRKAQHEVTSIMETLRTSAGIRRLAANPLLLRILALIHRTGAQLPHRRSELYELAADTLAHTWRVSKGMPESELVQDEFLTPLLSKLAYWLHINKSTGSAPKKEVYNVLVGQLTIGLP